MLELLLAFGQIYLLGWLIAWPILWFANYNRLYDPEVPAWSKTAFLRRCEIVERSFWWPKLVYDLFRDDS